MKKICYTDTAGNLCIVSPANYIDIVRAVPDLKEEEYEQFVWDRSIPADAINPRFIDDEHIPESREFRNAWCDVTQSPSIDIDVAKAKEIQLSKLRKVRDISLEIEDKNYMIALERGDDVDSIKLRKQQLRDITEPLKALKCDGKYNDKKLLAKIKELGTL